MSSRWSLCLTTALAVLSGCETVPLAPTSDLKDKIAEEETKGKVWERQEKLKPETLVYLGNMQMDSALEPAASPADRERLLGKARESFQRVIADTPTFVPA